MSKKTEVVQDEEIISKKDALSKLIKKIKKMPKDQLIDLGKKAFKLRKESFKGNQSMLELDLLRLSTSEIEELVKEID